MLNPMDALVIALTNTLFSKSRAIPFKTLINVAGVVAYLHIPCCTERHETYAPQSPLARPIAHKDFFEQQQQAFIYFLDNTHRRALLFQDEH